MSLIPFVNKSTNSLFFEILIMARGVRQLEWLFYQWCVLSQPSWTVLESKTVIFCCKGLTLSLYFQYCKTLIISVLFMPTHLPIIGQTYKLQTTQVSRYFAWIIEAVESGKEEQSCLSWEAELMFPSAGQWPCASFQSVFAYPCSFLWQWKSLIRCSYQ